MILEKAPTFKQEEDGAKKIGSRMHAIYCHACVILGHNMHVKASRKKMKKMKLKKKKKKILAIINL